MVLGACMHAQLRPNFATPRTVALQAPLSVGFSRQEYWAGLPFPPAGDRPNPGIIPASPVDSLWLSHPGSPNSLESHCPKIKLKSSTQRVGSRREGAVKNKN